MYELSLQASFRRDFATDGALGTELVLGGWSTKNGRMMANVKHDSAISARVQLLDCGLASPSQPLERRPGSFWLVDVLQAAHLQATWLNQAVGRQVAGFWLLR